MKLDMTISGEEKSSSHEPQLPELDTHTQLNSILLISVVYKVGSNDFAPESSKSMCWQISYEGLLKIGFKEGDKTLIKKDM